MTVVGLGGGAVLGMTYGKDVCDAEDADDDARGND